MIKNKKQVPESRVTSRYWAENFDDWEDEFIGASPLYTNNWRDFIKMNAKQNIDKNMEYLDYNPEKIIDKVMRRGSLSLGDKTKIIKCPGISQPGACLICPVDFKGDERILCSGPTVQRTKGGLIRSEKTYYDNDNTPCCSAYNWENLEDRDIEYKDIVAFVHQQLHDHPDYTVVTYEELFHPDTQEKIEKRMEESDEN